MPTKRSKKPITGKSPATKGYSPIDERWFQRPRDLPPFTFLTIRCMLLDPTIRLGLAMRAAPLCSPQWAYKQDGSEEWTSGIQADDPILAAFVLRQLKRLWQDAAEILRAQVWGWSACEVMYRHVKPGEGDAARHFIEIDRLLPRHANDARLLLCEGEPVQVRFLRIQEAPQGHVDLPFPKAFLHNHAPEPGQHYGMSILQGAYSPWSDKWLNGGALDVRRLFMHKDAYRGKKIFYPNDSYEVEGKGTIHARDIARENVEKAKSGAVETYPSDVDANGNPKWRVEESQVASNPQHILNYPKDLDTEMLRGMEVPDDIFTADADSTGAWAGKKVPLEGFYTGLDLWLTRLIRDVKCQVLDHLVAMNFGEGRWYDICAKPLGEQAMERQAKSGGQPMQPKQFGGFGRDGDSDGQFGEGGAANRMGLDVEEAVGRGTMRALELVGAARAAVKRLSTLSPANAVAFLSGNGPVEPIPVERSKFSSTHFNLSGDLITAIYAMQARIHGDDLAVDGIEINPHITVKYGIHTENVEEVRAAAKHLDPVAVQFGKASIFSSDEHDVVKIDVQSKGLHALNDAISRALVCTDTYPEYKPHVTVAYVKHGLGEKYAATLNDLEGRTAVFDRLIFSDRDRVHTSIPLLGKVTRFATDAQGHEHEAARAAFIRMEAAHAPKGYTHEKPLVIDGKQFVGGEFIPGDVLANATPEQKQEIAGESQESGRKRPGNAKKYGKSKAKVRIGDEPEFAEQTAKNIGKFLQDLGFRGEIDFASLVGAPDDAEVTVDFHPRRGITIVCDHKAFNSINYIKRTFKNRAYVELSDFWMKGTEQGKGLGSEVFARQVENCKDAGFASIQCHAAKMNPRDTSKPHNGYYTWPRLGFDQDLDDPDIPREDFRVFAEAQKKFPGAKSIHDVMATKEGRDWWKGNGTDLYAARFDLDEGSRSLQILESYMDERAQLASENQRAMTATKMSLERHVVPEMELSATEELALERAWAKLTGTTPAAAETKDQDADDDSQDDEEADD
ncbi:MAG: 2'-5' RNA ligase family protein [Planctomycetes bacterium]|nr:2'-5' RNA ligase family protein [Planctomycetota bacterium]